ncbi:SBBP repeat-containing protein [Rubrivirga sp. IMCC43871]|uniref:SBBP repeat-containing protein n=1 Tax=Rubrivirga sp. IMCC43871 TaxID=3391575 RepID=UPI0039902151
MTPRSLLFRVLGLLVLAGLLGATAVLAAPLRFEPNLGQSSAEVAFLARGSTSALFLTRNAAYLRVEGRVLVLGFGAVAMPQGIRPLPGHTHYVRGANARRWVHDVPGFAAVRYSSLAPGLDLTVRDHPDGLGLQLDLARGADLSALRWTVDGADAIAGAPDGGLLVTVGDATYRLPAPALVRQGIASAGRFRVDGTAVGVERGGWGAPVVEGAERRGPLLAYTTFLGGGGDEVGAGIVVDAEGAAYVTGRTDSADFPVSDTSPGSGPDVFITKVAPDGVTLMYSFVVGGVDIDIGLGIALAEDGSVLVTGETHSPDFPTTPGAYDTVFDPGPNAFVLKLAPDAAVVYSTFLGGDGVDVGHDVGVDDTGAAYVAGYTNSTDFPVTTGVVGPAPVDGFDVFAAKLSTDGSALVYGTYVGGSNDDFAYDLVVVEGEAYITGDTNSDDLPTTSGVLGPASFGDLDAFVLHLSVDASAMVLTYLGGAGEDLGEGIVVDSGGTVFVGGITDTSFPVTLSAAFPAPPGGPEAFLAVLTPGLSGIDYATYYGGTDLDYGCDVALDPTGLPVIVGKTNSVDLPVTDDAPQALFGGITDGFYARFDHTASGLDSFLDGTYLGGSNPDIAHAVAVSAASHAYLTGFSESLDFPTTPGTFDESFNGGRLDAFVARFPADFGTSVAVAPDVPTPLQLSAPMPNPLDREATLMLTSDRARAVRAVVVDMLGRAVATVWDGPVPPGTTRLTVDADQLSNGTYAIRVTGDGFTASRSLTVLR